MNRSFSFIVFSAVYVTLVQSFSLSETFDTFLAHAKGMIWPNEVKKLAVDHLNNVSVVDHTAPSFPKVRVGHRVVDLFHGWHFDDILMDTPDSIRPASVVAFYDSTDPKCMRDYELLNFDKLAETELPPRSQLFLSRYDMSADDKRIWYEFTPEMDLKKRFGVKSCPEVQFASRKCDGMTEWCERGADKDDPSLIVYGCEDFKESCPQSHRSVFDPKVESLKDFILRSMKEDGKPKITRFLGSMKDQGKWLRSREHTTCNTHFRNSFLSNAFPAFTPRGFKAMQTPPEFQKWLMDFVNHNQDKRKTEYWNAESTQLSFHEKPTTFIDMDLLRSQKNRMADKYLKPLLEEWSGMKDLELTAFYGMREYHEGAWLRQHIDRIDTHVLSVTFSVFKNRTEEKGDKDWPLRVTDWTGQQVGYSHPAGTMILYESSKLPHGRPTRNEGGVHLGCFLHYRPRNMGSSSEWSDIVSKARANQQRHTEFARYRSTPEVSDEGFEWAEDNVGEGSDWKQGSRSTDPSVNIDFVNRADRPLEIFWMGESDSKVSQGVVLPNERMPIKTYADHKFFWSEKGEAKALTGKAAYVTVPRGRSTSEAVYDLRKDGTPYKADL